MIIAPIILAIPVVMPATPVLPPPSSPPEFIVIDVIVVLFSVSSHCPVIVTEYEPIEADEEASMVMVLVPLPEMDDVENVVEAPEGRPEEDRSTDLEKPFCPATVIVNVALLP